MKKVFCVLSGLFFLQSASADNNEHILNQEDLPSFIDLTSIIENPYVQDNVRMLLYQILDMLRTAANSPTIKGNRQDINDAKRRISYLTSLEIGLEEAKNADRVKRLLGLNKDGIEDIRRLENIAAAVHNADTIDQISEIPEINEKVLEDIGYYRSLKYRVTRAESIQDIKGIPDISSKGIQAIESLEQLSNNLAQMKDIEQLVEDNNIGEEVKSKVSEAYQTMRELEEANSLSKLAQIKHANKSLIQKTREELTKYGVLKRKYEEAQKEKSGLNFKIKSITDDNARLKKFHMRLTAVLLRVLTGFDYRAAKFDFLADKNSRIPDKAVMIAASKTSFSHLGGHEDDLYEITNGIQGILKILLSESDWVSHLQVIKSHLSKLKTISDKLNEDGALIKLNINYAIDVIDSFGNGSRIPPRDNVQNFGSVQVQAAD